MDYMKKQNRKTCFFCKRKRQIEKLKESSRRIVVLRVYKCIDNKECLTHR